MPLRAPRAHHASPLRALAVVDGAAFRGKYEGADASLKTRLVRSHAAARRELRYRLPDPGSASCSSRSADGAALSPFEKPAADTAPCSYGHPGSSNGGRSGPSLFPSATSCIHTSTNLTDRVIAKAMFPLASMRRKCSDREGQQPCLTDMLSGEPCTFARATDDFC